MEEKREKSIQALDKENISYIYSKASWLKVDRGWLNAKKRSNTETSTVVVYRRAPGMTESTIATALEQEHDA